MKKTLKILMIASEMVPFAKTGGLADVIGALPIELKKLGHDIRVVIPKYSSVSEASYQIEPFLQPVRVWLDNSIQWCAIRRTFIKEDIPVYFVEHDYFFNRKGIYHDEFMNDYGDNPLRFGMLSNAALQLCRDISFYPDIIHAHDWQTAIVPALLKTHLHKTEDFKNIVSLLTLHNLAYQGVYPKRFYEALGLDWKYFTSAVFESYDHINLLKGGIYFADMVNTVSPTYSREVRKPFGGFGLAPILNKKKDAFVGILNGVDYSIWSPENDKYIPANYSLKNLAGKKICKRELQRLFNLNQIENAPLIGVIGRFVEQKGFHLIAQILDNILANTNSQFVILGSGSPELENYFKAIPGLYPGRFGSYIGFSDELAHLIEAGADFFLMPSLFEPCGLNQIYSLRYGTLPIVHATGGLDDTVINYDPKKATGTGFKFYDPSAFALFNTVKWAINTYYERPKHIKAMIQQAMAKDFSWRKISELYVELYRKAIIYKTMNKIL